jgi:hypothetical protein
VSLIDNAERLKKELTDKWVVVNASTPELKRFANLTGKVKTVNMNCRALVEFDGPVDISWYDIDTSFLTVVAAPKPKKAETHAEAKPAAKPASSGTPSAAASGSGSPLDKIRAGAKPASVAPAASSSPLDKIRSAAKPAAPAGGSPLDKIRAAAAKPAATESGSESEVKTPSAEEEPATPMAEVPVQPASSAPASGSPLDRIRAMGAPKKG